VPSSFAATENVIDWNHPTSLQSRRKHKAWGEARLCGEAPGLKYLTQRKAAKAGGKNNLPTREACRQFHGLARIVDEQTWGSARRASLRARLYAAACLAGLLSL